MIAHNTWNTCNDHLQYMQSKGSASIKFGNLIQFVRVIQTGES